VRSWNFEAGHAVDHVNREAEAIYLIQDRPVAKHGFKPGTPLGFALNVRFRWSMLLPDGSTW
jgi:hypothetical protein